MGCDSRWIHGEQSRNVSIHAPVWGATCLQRQKHYSSPFQSTHPCGVRRFKSPAYQYRRQFQSTHPCGVRHPGGDTWYWRFVVSIHAPVWGATLDDSNSPERIWFQSTHPCGVRHHLLGTQPILLVSIHAPVWGATGLAFRESCLTQVSIHAPVWGATWSIR